MGRKEYQNVSKRALLTALTALTYKYPSLTLSTATKHNYVLKFEGIREAQPVVIGHPILGDWVVDEICKWLVKNDICLKSEFDSLLKKR